MGVFNIRGMELNQAKFGDWMKKTFDLAKKCWYQQQMHGFNKRKWELQQHKCDYNMI